MAAPPLSGFREGERMLAKIDALMLLFLQKCAKLCNVIAN